MQKQNHILVVDDDEQLRTTLCEQLLSEGYTVTMADDGEKALATIKEKNVDVAVVDVKMPKVNGFEVLEFVKKNYPNIKIIMLTAYADLRNVNKCKELGADDVIEKPYDIGDLFDSIHYVSKRE